MGGVRGGWGFEDELVEPKNRSRTFELRSFSCLNLAHEFEFEIRISDQIQTLLYLNIVSFLFSFAKNIALLLPR